MAETIQSAPDESPSSALLIWRYILTGAVISAAIWLMSPYVQDRREPWDSPYFIYRGGYLLAGMILGFGWPKPYARGLPNAWLGAWLGQLPFIATSEFRNLGFIATAFGSLFFAGGTFIGTMFRREWKKRTGI